MKHELQDLIQGKSGDSQTKFIQQIAAHLRSSKIASASNEKSKYSKQQEEACLVELIDEHKLWYQGIISDNAQIGEGAEQKVYYDAHKGVVVKINDSIFFAYWEDYFNNLIIHNYFFPDTAYTLLGFRIMNDALFAVVEQQHIIRTEEIDLEQVKDFLRQNGFENTRRNDYYNNDLGIILEDLHDENVISSGHIPYFIDTVFYLTNIFYDGIIN